MKKLLPVLIIIVIAVLAFIFGKPLWNKFFSEKMIVLYTEQPVLKTNLCKYIESTGTVEPEELVNVGAQIGGMVIRFGPDTKGKAVDYGSRVKAGGILAQIDDSLYLAERDIAKANCEQGKAAIASAQASQEEAQSHYNLTKAEWERTDHLFDQGVATKSERDNAFSAYEKAKAALALNKAKLMQAKAQLTAYNAQLSKAERNLGYCVITSPVDGVIIDRRVNIGQTVNASMNAPSLFLIAKDLRKMQVWVSVNEADVGVIRSGQRAEFTVDAFPDRVFQGVVKKIRLNATMSQNVVTFVVEIDTDNADETLLPYLTANVKFILAERKNVTAVPNAAFRFTPGGVLASNAPVPGKGQRLLWVKEKDKKTLRPILVRTGLNDGSRTEVLEGDIQPGMMAVTGSRVVSERQLKGKGKGPGNANSTNPFLPQMPKRNNNTDRRKK
jgi:HlyD family secretion protein